MVATMDAQTLLKKAQSERSCGRVLVIAEELPSDKPQRIPAVVDAFTSRHGLRSLGDHWHEVSAKFADTTLTWLLTHDLAYSAPLMSENVARELAEQFLGWFRPDASFFANLVVDDEDVIRSPNEYVSMPLTNATFDAGIVGVDSKHIGIFWFSDED